MNDYDRSELKRLFDSPAVKSAIEAKKGKLRKAATKNGASEEARQSALQMLWGLEALETELRSSTAEMTKKD